MIDAALSLALAVLAWLGVLVLAGVVLFVGSAAIAGIRQARRQADVDRAFRAIIRRGNRG